ncbi:Anthocyanidin 3-O-glucosyltransferase 2 [Vitis vinifera]|uniref:Glycosyltransferase n=1 Tax=Vitis vinifera TaxID=29760 RepID=A0A438H5P5_VITVI|nr:Anthocyanidin 3-O-glucosyltransferase 2 [Vitis vinifera]
MVSSLKLSIVHCPLSKISPLDSDHRHRRPQRKNSNIKAFTSTEVCFLDQHEPTCSGLRFPVRHPRRASAQSDDVDDNIKAYNVADGMPEGHVLSGNPQEGIELFLKATPGNFREVVEVAEGESGMRISCLLTDAFLWFAGEMAEDRCIPWVPLWTSGPVSLAVHVYTDDIRKMVLGANGIEGHEVQTLDFIPGLSSIHAVDLPEEIVSGSLDSPFSQMLHKMGLTLPRAAAVVINSFEEMEPTVVNDLKSKFKKFVNVGPFTLSSPPPLAPDSNSCLLWLDRQKAASVAYISFGTIITPPPHELVALAEALESTGVPFLWSLRDNSKDNLPKGFLERTSQNGKVVPWAPQLQVLGHAQLECFVTHCGWNSVTESIVCGVPMICRPFFGDQNLNRRMVQDVWGIGVGVKGGVFTKSGLTRDLELILGA